MLACVVSRFEELMRRGEFPECRKHYLRFLLTILVGKSQGQGGESWSSHKSHGWSEQSF